MGLSSKQVSSDGQDWNQSFLQAASTTTTGVNINPPHHAAAASASMVDVIGHPKQQHEQLISSPANYNKRKLLAQAGGDQAQPLNCPRCDSTNTKFCYYNNYNKSQPRYLCKSCKRHWTKGGTLRNVPVGGGRKKKKRIKTSSNNISSNHHLATTSSDSTKPIPATKSTTFSNIMNPSVHQIKEHHDGFPLPVFDTKEGSSSFFNNNDNNNINITTMPFDSTTTTSPLSSLNPLDHQNLDLHQFPYSLNLNTPFDDNDTPCMSNSNFQLYNHDQAPSTTSISALEETVMAAAAAGLHETSTISGSSGSPHDQLPWTTTTTTMNMHTSTSTTTFSTSSSMPTTDWGWDDIDKFASVDITIPWDDDDIDINIP